MKDDPRCCGSGTCIIDPEGRCWCGQQWDGQKMVSPTLTLLDAAAESGQGTPEADPPTPT